MTALMQGKRGLVMGVANDHSIAWGIAKTLAAHGAALAFTYQGEALGRRVKPLADTVKSNLVLPCDVEDIGSVDAMFAELKQQWGTMDFLVHAIGFSDKNELKGRYADTTRANFDRCFQIMDCDDPRRLQEWLLNWSDLMQCEIVPVVPSAETRELVEKHL